MSSLGPSDRERGSMVVAVAVILIVSLLGATIAARSVGGAFISSFHQSSAAAVSQADAGLADALYRIDQGTAGTGTGSAFCVRPHDVKCLAASVPAASGVSYLATRVSGTDWLVQSEAAVGQTTAAVEGHVTQQPAYPFALFGSGSLDFNSSSSQTFAAYSASMPASSTAPVNPDPNGAVSVGSNSSVTCNGRLGTNVTVSYYGGGGVGSTGTADCGNYQRFPDRYFLSSPTAPSGAMGCPGIGGSVSEFGSGFPGAPTALAGGTYLCTTPVSFSGTLDVLGAVQLYVILDSSYGGSTPAITIAPGSYINDRADYCAHGGSSGCSPAPNLPNSQNLEIFSNSNGTIGNNAGPAYYLGALLYAPDASLTQDGCASHYYGSVVVRTFTCSNGGPSLNVSYDSSLSSVYGPWTSGAYTEINPSVFNAAMAASGL